MAFPQIAAIVLRYGQWQKTATCVDSLLKSALQPAWVIVVDNASADDSGARIETWLAGRAGQRVQVAGGDACGMPPARLTLIKRKNNAGYAAGNNAGIRLAREWGADAYLIVNNDARLTSSALGAMWERLDRGPRPGLCGPLLVYQRPDEPVQCCAGGFTNYVTGLSTFSGAGLSIAQAQSMEAERIEAGLNFICGACLLVSSAFIEKVGLMDEGYFLYCEEQDWALRARGKFDLAYAPDAVVYHDEGATTGWNRYAFQWRSSLRMFRSRLRLAWLHHPWFLPTVFTGCFFAACRLAMKRLLFGG